MSNKEESQEERQVINLLMEIKAQNAEQLERINELEKTATKRGAIAGAVAGSITGGVITIGIEFIKAKLGM